MMAFRAGIVADSRGLRDRPAARRNARMLPYLRLARPAPPPLLVGALSLFGLAVPAAAQQAPAPRTIQTADDPWLYKGSDIIQDPEWHFGRLPNGVRYVVRKNGVPPGQGTVRVRIDAGSLMETG